MSDDTSPAYHARVLKSWTVQYPDFIELEAGDLVTLGKRDSEYPGWIWATSAKSGKSGWVPECYLRVDGESGSALRSYTARELGVSEGEIVTVTEELLGWVWAAAGERQGWMPLTHLARSARPVDLPL